MLGALPQNGHIEWSALVEQLNLSHPAQITQLRQLLRGLQRNEEVNRERQGRYFLPHAQPMLQGVVERQGKVLRVEDQPIVEPQKSLREGDRVA